MKNMAKQPCVENTPLEPKTRYAMKLRISGRIAYYGTALDDGSDDSAKEIEYNSALDKFFVECGSVEAASLKLIAMIKTCNNFKDHKNLEVKAPK